MRHVLCSRDLLCPARRQTARAHPLRSRALPSPAVPCRHVATYPNLAFPTILCFPPHPPASAEPSAAGGPNDKKPRLTDEAVLAALRPMRLGCVVAELCAADARALGFALPAHAGAAAAAALAAPAAGTDAAAAAAGEELEVGPGCGVRGPWSGRARAGVGQGGGIVWGVGCWGRGVGWPACGPSQSVVVQLCACCSCVWSCVWSCGQWSTVNGPQVLGCVAANAPLAVVAWKGKNSLSIM